MIRNIDLYQLTQLAEASYSNFWNSSTNTPFIADDKVGEKLGLLDNPIGDTQAASLLSQWSVSSHQKNTENGFSATLFRSKDPSTPDEYVLALRGTEQFIIDLIIADGLDIVRDGLAMDQIVDL